MRPMWQFTILHDILRVLCHVVYIYIYLFVQLDKNLIIYLYTSKIKKHKSQL